MSNISNALRRGAKVKVQVAAYVPLTQALEAQAAELGPLNVWR
jgi:hypothetical protein